MPDRIVRDEILDSDRYLGLSSDSLRTLFVHFLLVADDLGNSEASGPFIRRRLLGGAQTPDETIAKMLAELQDVDLIRTYFEGAKRYVHIPRFRQRLRSFKRVNPRPPTGIECKEIKAIADKLSDNRQTDAGQMTDTCQSLAGEGRKEVKEGRNARAGASPVDNSAPKVNGGRNIAQRSKAKPAPGVTFAQAAIEATAKALGLKPHPGETAEAYADRVKQAKANKARH